MASPAKAGGRRGRRQGEPVSRDAVLRAAKRRFADTGYDKTTLRAIAQDAHVDAAMVIYLFGSKAQLFREAMQLLLDPDVLIASVVGADTDTDTDADVGTRMARAYIGMWEQPDVAASMIAMLQSATSNPDAHEAFRGFMQDYVLAAISGALGGGEDAKLRAMLAATSLVGTAMLRYVIRVPPLATLPAAQIVDLIGPTITRYLTAGAAELKLG